MYWFKTLRRLIEGARFALGYSFSKMTKTTAINASQITEPSEGLEVILMRIM